MAEYFWKTLISAAVAYLTPKILGNIGSALKSEAQTDESPLPILPWLLAGLIGGAAGSAFSAAMGNQGAGNWAAYGAALGIMQWFVLRNRLPVGGWWALASALGWAAFPLVPQTAGLISAAMGGVTVGLAVGILQIIGLKADGVGWWIGGNAVAWGLTGAIAFLIAPPIMMIFGPMMGWLVGWGVVGLLGFLFLLYPLANLHAQKAE